MSLSFETHVLEDQRRGMFQTAWTFHRVRPSECEDAYLKIEYISEEDWKEHFPTVWHLEAFKGNCELQSALERRDDLTDDLILEATFDYDQCLLPEDPEAKREEVERLTAERMPFYRGFRNYHVDRPSVSYVRVPKAHRRKNIASRMYEAMGTWLADRNMRLHSGMLNEKSRKLWQHFLESDMFPAGTHRFEKPTTHYTDKHQCYYLDYQDG